MLPGGASQTPGVIPLLIPTSHVIWVVFSHVAVPTTLHRQLPAPPTLTSDGDISYEAETTSVSQHLCESYCLIHDDKKFLGKNFLSHKSFYNNFHRLH